MYAVDRGDVSDGLRMAIGCCTAVAEEAAAAAAADATEDALGPEAAETISVTLRMESLSKEPDRTTVDIEQNNIVIEMMITVKDILFLVLIAAIVDTML